MSDSQALITQWQADWQTAVNLWSRYTKLREPTWCSTSVIAAKEGLSGSFAMIRLRDQTVVIDLEQIIESGLQAFGVEILAHEIGHHILAPANLTDHALMIARIRKNLPTIETRSSMVANLFTDLLINNHLKQVFQLRIDEVYRRLLLDGQTGKVWSLYMRIYELLWQLPPGELGGHASSEAMEGDAWLGARIVKVYAQEPLKGAARFGALLLPYLLEEKEIAKAIQLWLDTQKAAEGGTVTGILHQNGDDEDGVHPANDSALTGIDSDNTDNKPAATEPQEGEQSSGAGQFREPFEFGDVLRAAGLSISDHDVAVRYYKERAIPHLVPFPSEAQPKTTDLIPEGVSVWEPGEAIEEIDWFATVAASRQVIPGVTTLKREWGHEQDQDGQLEVCDLDLYVDCSGSMPNPQQTISYTTLAGAILALSALKAGARVQTTLWSGARQFKTTNGFTRNETTILNVLTDYLGGATAFPIHILRETHVTQPPKRKTHIVILSDDGVSTLFDEDEQGHSGWDIAERALANAQGGGTMVLNLHWDYPNPPESWGEYYLRSHEAIRDAEHRQSWAVYPVSSWQAMLDFAKRFSQEHYVHSEPHHD